MGKCQYLLLKFIIQPKIFLTNSKYFRSTKIVTHLIPLISLISSALSIEIHCNFEYYDWSTEINFKVIPVVSDYSCIAELIGFSNHPAVSEVTGSHLFGNRHRNVRIIQISNQQLEKMPRKLDNFFPNIFGLFINHCNLTNISSSDLKPYKYLKYFSVKGNLLTTIDGNLFEHNRDLKFVSFGLNSIEKVGKNLLDNLYYLQKVSFVQNKCIDRAAIHNKQEIADIIIELNEKCSK